MSMNFDKTRKLRVADDEPEGLLGDAHLAILTFSILGLVCIMLVFIGHEAIITERNFFRKVALRTNQKIADLISQQFAQVFSNTTGLLEDMSHFPSVVDMKPELCNYLFELILKRHSIFRSIYIIRPEDIDESGNFTSKGRHRWEWFNTNVTTFKPLDGKMIRELFKGWVPSKLTGYYSIEQVPAITYACAIRDRSSVKVVGILVAEIKLNFIQRVIDSAELGRTGDVLVVDKRGSIVFSTPGFADVDSFNKHFPADRAYKNHKGGVEFGVEKPKLASYTRIQEMTTKPMLPGVLQLPYTTTITPREIPDWLIVVLQDSAEGYVVADRLKWNIILLLVVGAVGVFIIGKLWVDSFH